MRHCLSNRILKAFKSITVDVIEINDK